MRVWILLFALCGGCAYFIFRKKADDIKVGKFSSFATIVGTIIAVFSFFGLGNTISKDNVNMIEGNTVSSITESMLATTAGDNGEIENLGNKGADEMEQELSSTDSSNEAFVFRMNPYIGTDLQSRLVDRKDNWGNEYVDTMKGFEFDNRYIIDGAYDELSFIIFLDENDKHLQDWLTNQSLEIYGDDELLFSITNEDTPYGKASSYSIDVSGVKELHIISGINFCQNGAANWCFAEMMLR